MLLDANHPDLAVGQGDHWLDAWIFIAGRAAVRDVLIGGERVVIDGRHRDHESVTRPLRRSRQTAARRMNMHAPRMRSALPRYAAIRRDLESAILSGRWPPGHKVPSEHELVARYGCARMTVNKALSELAAAGLIVRHRRAGSFVATPTTEESILEIHDLEAEARRDGKAYRFELTARALRKATAADAERLDIVKGVPILALGSIHHVAGAPFAAEDRLINLATVPAAADADFSSQAAGKLAAGARCLGAARATAFPRSMPTRAPRAV